MNGKKVQQIFEILGQMYPDAECELDFGSNFELLVAVILSAQCTDKRVNKVTQKLFSIASTPQQFDIMPIEELESHIFSCGFYHNKARSIKNMSSDLISRFNGEVPSDFDELLSLDGVGRKTANVMMSVAFKKNAIAVDTHVFRLSHRLGFSCGKTPYEVEKDLRAQIPSDLQSIAHHLMIFHGRYCCKSRSPECFRCDIRGLCDYFDTVINLQKEQ